MGGIKNLIQAGNKGKQQVTNEAEMAKRAAAVAAKKKKS